MTRAETKGLLYTLAALTIVLLALRHMMRSPEIIYFAVILLALFAIGWLLLTALAYGLAWLAGLRGNG